MEEIEWSRQMAPLLLDLYLSAMSELPSASSKPISTTPCLTFNPLENRFTEKSFKIFACPLFMVKILFTQTLDITNRIRMAFFWVLPFFCLQ